MLSELRLQALQHVLKTWRFKPAMQNGQAVQAYGLVPIAFSLPAGSYATVLLRELMKSHSTVPENEDSGTAEPSPEVGVGEDLPGVLNRVDDRQVDASKLADSHETDDDQ